MASRFRTVSRVLSMRSRSGHMRTAYDVLGVRPDADDEEVRLAFRQRAKACHPDLHGGNEGADQEFRNVTAAYHLLKHPGLRAAYNVELRREREDALRRRKSRNV